MRIGTRVLMAEAGTALQKKKKHSVPLACSVSDETTSRTGGSGGGGNGELMSQPKDEKSTSAKSHRSSEAGVKDGRTKQITANQGKKAFSPKEGHLRKEITAAFREMAISEVLLMGISDTASTNSVAAADGFVVKFSALFVVCRFFLLFLLMRIKLPMALLRES